MNEYVLHLALGFVPCLAFWVFLMKRPIPIKFVSRQSLDSVDQSVNGLNGLWFVKLAKGMEEEKAVPIMAEEIFEYEYRIKNLYKYFLKGTKRSSEIKGRAVKLAARVDYGKNYHEELLGEAKALTYYKQFKGMNIQDIMADLEEQRNFGRKWWNSNKNDIMSHMAEYPYG